MTLDVQAWRAAVAVQVREWAERQARLSGMDVEDPRTTDWIESLIRYRLQGTLPAAPARGAIPGQTGISEAGAVTDITEPVEFAFLCFPTAYPDFYGYSAAGDPLDWDGLDSQNQWHSPIVKVTHTGYEWGADCMDTGWYYWLGSDHTTDNWDSVSWGWRIAVPEGGDEFDRLNDRNIWENQAQAVDQGDIAQPPFAACKVTIVNDEYYRWCESASVVKQRQTNGTTVQTITVTGVASGTLRHAEFSASGERLALSIDLAAGGYAVYEAVIGSATSGSIAATLKESVETSSTFSDQLVLGGTERHVSYSGSCRAPVKAGYSGETLKVAWVVVDADSDYEYSNTPDPNDPAGNWPYSATGGCWIVEVVGCGAAPAQTWWAVYEDDIDWYTKPGGATTCQIWIEIDSTRITDKIDVYQSDQVTFRSTFGLSPDKVLSGCKVDGNCQAPSGCQFETQCEVIYGNGASFCGDVASQLGCDHPVAPLCADCTLSGGSYSRERDEEGYTQIQIPFRGIDAAGSIGTVILGSKKTFETSATTVSGLQYSFQRQSTETTHDETFRVVSSEDGTISISGVTSGTTSFLWADDQGSQSGLESNMLSLIENAMLQSPNTGYIDAIAKQLSTGAYVWSVRIRDGVDHTGYTSINGTVPTWMPANGHIVGWNTNYAYILEAPCGVT